MVGIVSLSIDLSVSKINIIIDMYIRVVVLTHIYLIKHVDIKIVLNVFYIL